MRYDESLYKRNRLIIIFMIIGSVFATVILYLGGMESYRVLRAMSPLAVLCILAFYLHLRRLHEKFIKYLIVFGLGISSYVIIDVSSNPIGIYMIFLTIAIISIYNEYRALALITAVQVFNLNYFGITIGERIFFEKITRNFINANMMLMIFVLFIYLQIKHNKELTDQIRHQMDKVKKSNDMLAIVIDNVKVTIDGLERFSEELKYDVELTNVINHEIAKNITTVTGELSSKNEDILLLNEEINNNNIIFESIIEDLKHISAIKQEVIKLSAVEDILNPDNSVDMTVVRRNVGVFLEDVKKVEAKMSNIYMKLDSMEKGINYVYDYMKVIKGRSSTITSRFKSINDSVKKHEERFQNIEKNFHRLVDDVERLKSLLY